MSECRIIYPIKVSLKLHLPPSCFMWLKRVFCICQVEIFFSSSTDKGNSNDAFLRIKYFTFCGWKNKYMFIREKRFHQSNILMLCIFFSCMWSKYRFNTTNIFFKLDKMTWSFYDKIWPTNITRYDQLLSSIYFVWNKK